MTLTLWGRPSSVNVQKVLWALDEFGEPFEHRVVGGAHGGLDDPAFAALTPARRVPVLQDGAVAVWESHAILRRLGRRRPDHPLSGGLDAADPWMDYGATTLQPPFIALFWQRVRLAPNARSAELEARAAEALAGPLGVIDHALSDREWIAGPSMTLADVALGTPLWRLAAVAPELVEGRAALLRWGEALASRPGHAKHVAVSFEALRA